MCVCYVLIRNRLCDGLNDRFALNAFNDRRRRLLMTPFALICCKGSRRSIADTTATADTIVTHTHAHAHTVALASKFTCESQYDVIRATKATCNVLKTVCTKLKLEKQLYIPLK